jgi:exosortase/archaeosortase family protein
VPVILLRVLLLTLFLTTPVYAQSVSESFSIVIVRPDGSSESRGAVVGVPEFSVLRRLPRLPEAQGHVLAAKLAARNAMQRATAWGATGVLKVLQRPATQRGVFIDLSPFTFEIEPWCAGTQGLKLLLAVGLVLALVLRPGIVRGVAFVGLAGLIAVETNVLRVVATALTYDAIGRTAWGWKDWIAGTTTIFAVVQVIGLGWLLNRTVRAH